VLVLFSAMFNVADRYSALAWIASSDAGTSQLVRSSPAPENRKTLASV
jgi:hypothetical protein